ncbi:hypothetical protein PMIN01_05755 [Paraphaeosphaeria minitans]|uniref:Uncharacterized protein n=1 Tax=Paraphaeosphaeria minitans TaxID=565426 RepID=A0A9P6GIZ3_9PLEO|nr:hypothetical protein PMIN01_05755 [Paraphaeosphaeria minitans]
MYSFVPMGKNNISGAPSLYASTGIVWENVSEIVAMGTSITIPSEIHQSQRAGHSTSATRERPLA